MTNQQLNELEQQEKELLAKLASIRAAKEQAIKNAPIQVRIGALITRPGTRDREIHIESPYRVDLLDVYHSIKSRRYAGGQSNYISIRDYESFLNKLASLTNIELSYVDGVKEAIEKEINQPVWDIKLERLHIRIYPGPGHDYYQIRNIPSLEYVNILNPYYKIQLSEGWRLWEALQDVERVHFDDDASQFILEQINTRRLIDEIGSAKDWPYEVEFFDKSVVPRPAQRVAMAFVEATGIKTLVSYDMGLGKTIISLGVAVKNNFRTLVICPAPLKPKWCKEIKKLTNIEPIVLLGTSPSTFDMKNMLMEKHQFYVCNYDTISRSFEYVKETKDEANEIHIEKERRFLWIDLINMANFDLIIIDESHYAKNTDSGRSQAVSRLKYKGMIQLTGTPVLNRASEYYPTLNLLHPETFPSQAQFIQKYTGSSENLEALKEVLKPIMIRRRHDDIYDDLPPKNSIPQYVELTGKILKTYAKAEAGIYAKMAEFEANSANYEPSSHEIPNILAKIQRLKMISAIGKVDATADLATRLQDNAEESGSRYKKILIFSQFLPVAYAIAQRLGHEALCTVERGEDFYSMNVNQRQSIIDQFQSEDKYKYLITTLAAKEGHDITEAGFVIFNDLFWTPANHDQCTGRAYMRENDPHGVDVYYQITDMNGDSIDEWIWELLAKKGLLIETVVDGVEGSRDVSIASELIKKFKEHGHSRKKYA